MITITEREYRSLLKASEKLRRLEAFGVGDWEWYETAFYRDEGVSYDKFCNNIDAQYPDKAT